ncbi:hypothetical protein A2690_03710 [Candidatus Roizmanbacteria bacterium RIFCSPHIGHO2_01_FULL_39_12b]|uniref:Type II secretion system protein GspF domain-containing protein n=1 Tax=Candidatus Roizmanbacteria bacterium RIFCSPHIGHO2_01_FULL_39_12b TaxID=1802030 RepID=A0A1F7GDD6_9BACT|nr:MAG: hypothetical protein A2690_03710 [Candidatus Roizmanbacteria bacterium RIFCSPHIGHO2_01_FULL_39_12b]
MKFSYTALNKGNTVKGKYEAENEQKLIEYLRGKGMTVLSVTIKKASAIASYQATFSRVSFNDVVDFTRKIAMMLNAGLTIVDALEILKKQTDKPSLMTLIIQIDTDVRAGASLSTALKKHKNAFNNLYISLIKAGEASGKLDEIMLKLADNLDKERSFKGKIRGALVYPALVVFAMFIVMFVMVTFVIPQLLNLYKDFNIDLPITTVILMAVSNFFQKTWPLLIIGVVGLSLLFKRYLATKTGKKSFDLFLLKLPIISNVIRMSALVDSTRTLSILIASGVSILDGLSIVTETTDNVVYQEAFQNVYTDVEKGSPIGKALEDTGVFPPILVQMASVGEQTGNLDDTLSRISKYFEMESELAVKAMTTLIEPAILLVLGAFVGFLVMSVITPIYNLTSSFK